MALAVAVAHQTRVVAEEEVHRMKAMVEGAAERGPTEEAGALGTGLGIVGSGGGGGLADGWR